MKAGDLLYCHSNDLLYYFSNKLNVTIGNYYKINSVYENMFIILTDTGKECIFNNEYKKWFMTSSELRINKINKFK